MPEWIVNFNIRVRTDKEEVLRLLSRIHAFASVIKSIPIPPGVQRRLDALNIMRAVRGTTGIEGAELTEEEVEQIMSAPKTKHVLPKSRRREEIEARNSEELMHFIAHQLIKNPDTPLTEDLICQIHEITTKNINYLNNIPGKYRSHAVSARTYIPPRTEKEVRRLMNEFIDWFNNGPPKSWDNVLKAIVAHFYVVSIHPFGDGNGRVSRGVESFLLFKAGVNARGFYSLANYYYRNRNEYVQMLGHVRFQTNSDLTPFVLFALEGLSDELEMVHNEVLSQVLRISFRDYAREVLLKHGKLGSKPGERMFHFLLDLAGPVSLKELRSGKHELSHYYSGVTKKTLSRDLNFLKEYELVIIDGDELTANYAVMTRFMPPA